MASRRRIDGRRHERTPPARGPLPARQGAPKGRGCWGRGRARGKDNGQQGGAPRAGGADTRCPRGRGGDGRQGPLPRDRRAALGPLRPEGGRTGARRWGSPASRSGPTAPCSPEPSALQKLVVSPVLVPAGHAGGRISIHRANSCRGRPYGGGAKSEVPGSIGPGLCIMLDANFGELLFHALR